MIALLKSLLYMFLFLFFLRFLSYIFRFFYFFLNKNLKTDISKTYDDKALKMLQCEKCKIYILKADAYIKNGKVYCCHEHSI